MLNASDSGLISAMVADLSEAWAWIKDNHPAEKLYAFGIYSDTDSASTLRPFACGAEGLNLVSQRYVREGIYPNSTEASQALRWSIPDSPYELKLPSGQIAEEICKRPDPMDSGVTEVRARREIKARLNAALEAIRSLDEQRLFGTGVDREQIVLLLEAGDSSSDDFGLKSAKKLNPPAVFKSYQAAFRRKILGRWTELGSTMFCTRQISGSADGRLVATASQYDGCVFDVKSGKRLFCRHFPEPKEYKFEIQGVSMNRAGNKIAYLPHGETLCIVGGTKWKSQKTIKFECGAQSVSLVGEPDGKWYAIGFNDNVVRVIDDSGAMLAELHGFKDWPRDLSLSPDGSHLAGIDWKGGVRVWSTSDWTLTCAIPEARGHCIAFDPTGRQLVTVLKVRPQGEDESELNCLKFWAIPEGNLASIIRFPGLNVTSARYSPDGRKIACGVDNRKAFETSAVLIDLQAEKICRRLMGPCGTYLDFVFLPERNAIAVAGGFSVKQLILWELSEPETDPQPQES